MEISKEIGAATGLRPRRPASLYGGSLKVPCLREECSLCACYCRTSERNEMPTRCWADPTRSARGPLVANLAAFWQQISPIVPVLPTVPAHKSCAVYNLAFEAFHGMEEVIGSIPIRSTKQPLQNQAYANNSPDGTTPLRLMLS